MILSSRIAREEMLEYGRGFQNPRTSPRERHLYLAKAARLYATIDNVEERKSLMRWWIEGVKVFCKTHQELLTLQRLLRNEAIRHITMGKY